MQYNIVFSKIHAVYMRITIGIFQIMHIFLVLIYGQKILKM